MDRISRRDFGRRMLGMAGAAVGGPSLIEGLAPDRGRRPRARNGEPLRVDGERLLRTFDGLRPFGRTPDGGLSRVAYGDADLAAREYLTVRMREAGLETRIDAGGNLLGTRGGREAGLPPILFGSHIDSVPGGGHYDGQVGSAAAVEVAAALRDHGVVTRHPLEVVIFQNEEGGLYGSRSLAGSLQAAELDTISASGLSIRDGIRRLGGDPDRLAEAARGAGEVAAYLELHIEQGSVLESRGIDIGVVEGIVGIRWWDVTVDGFANHAGTTPMDGRRDALLAAARYVDAVNRVVTARPGAHVGTVGRIAAEPGAPNVIPGRVTASLELRDLRMETIEALFADVREAAREIADATDTEFHFDLTVDLAPAPVAEPVQELVEGAARALGLSALRMPSGAGHDAQSLAPIAPIGMIFVPSEGGVSHSPAERTTPEAIVNGANVLLGSVLAMDGGP